MYFKYLNDKLVKSSYITTDDRGFRYGDGLFELISIFNSTLYLWEYHIQRLVRGLDILRIPKCDLNNLYNKSYDLININGIEEGLLRIIITRGPMNGGYEITEMVNDTTILIEVLDSRKIIDENIALCISSWRKPSIKSLPITAKTLQGLNSILSRLEAKDNKCFEAILLNDQDYISEVSSGNIFWFKNGVLYTPDISNGLLPGITRRRIIELSPFIILEGNYRISDVLGAESVFITNTSWIALPVRKIILNSREEILINNKELVEQITKLIICDKRRYYKEFMN